MLPMQWGRFTRSFELTFKVLMVSLAKVSGILLNLLHSMLSLLKLVKFPKVAGSASSLFDASSRTLSETKFPTVEGSLGSLLRSRTRLVRRVSWATQSTSTKRLEVKLREIRLLHDVANFGGRTSNSWPTMRR